MQSSPALLHPSELMLDSVFSDDCKGLSQERYWSVRPFNMAAGMGSAVSSQGTYLAPGQIGMLWASVAPLPQIWDCSRVEQCYSTLQGCDASDSAAFICYCLPLSSPSPAFFPLHQAAFVK